MTLKYPRLTKCQDFFHWNTKCFKTQLKHHKFKKKLKYPILDHGTCWVLRHKPGQKGPGKTIDRVMVSYGYTVRIKDLEERLKDIRQTLSELGYAMSQRTVMYGDHEAHEYIFATKENIHVASQLVFAMNQKRSVGQQKVQYI